MQQPARLSFRSNKGFTLVEVMVVIAIISILAAIGIPKLGNYLKRAEASEASQQFGRILEAAEAYALTHQKLSTAQISAALDGAPCLFPATFGNGNCGGASSLTTVIPQLILASDAEFTYLLDTEVNASNDLVYCIMAISNDDAAETILFSSSATTDPTWENYTSFQAFFDSAVAHTVPAGYCQDATPTAQAACTNC